MSTNASSGWALAIDFGTSYTFAAVAENGRVEPLDVNGQRRIPSVVFLNEDGTLAVGEAALNRAGMAPERLEMSPKAYLDGAQPQSILGDRAIDVTTLVGRIYHEVLQEALRQHNGRPPERVILTHPAAWSRRRLDLLVASAREGGIHDPVLVSEPEAAALHLSSERSGGEPVPEGGCVAVYDLGGGTVDMAALRHAGERFELIGRPGGDERIGGLLFDDLLYHRLGETAFEPEEWQQLSESDAPEWRRANRALRDEVRQAKEEVSHAPTYTFYVPEPIGREVQVTREQVEDLIREHVQRTLDLLERTLTDAGLSAEQLSALYLVGGSSRIPMIKHEVKARFGRADTKGEPKAVVALGAAGRDPLGQPTPEKPPIQEPPPVPPPVRAKRRFPAKAVATLAAVLALGGGVAAIAAPDDNTVPSPPPWTTSEPVDPDPAEPNPAPDPEPAESPVIGTWSGTVTDSTDTVEQAVTIDIDSFDGLGDGTLETQIGDEYCSYDLAYVETSGAEEIFEAEGDCASSMVSVEYDSDLDSLWYHEEWEYEGTSYVYSGFIDRG